MSWKQSVFIPLGAVLMLVITLILAGLTVAASISGALTAAAVSASGLVVIVLIKFTQVSTYLSKCELAMIRMFGGGD
jgi:uncharacterized membrane protein YfbV (UPF0208 family)